MMQEDEIYAILKTLDNLHDKKLTIAKKTANLISKLNFYKLIPYPMDNCFTGQRLPGSPPPLFSDLL